MMRILVTGVTGQVGGALLAPLQALGTVIPASRKELDLARTETIALLLDRLRPDLIVNPAAYTAVDRAEDARDLAFRVNAQAPAAIATWCALARVPLVHFSTDYVFDGSGDRPWREGDRAVPLSVYGASKLAGDDAVRAAGGAHLIVRTSWVYAARGINFLRTITRLARERNELTIVADQVGAPTSARVIAETVAAIIASSGDGLAEAFAKSGGVINVAAEGETTWHGFATAIVQGLLARGVPVTVASIVPIATAQYPTKARRPANSKLDLSRLRTVFGIVPQRWDEALERELDVVAAEYLEARSGPTAPRID